jgi:hypothetical protein
MRTHKDSAVLKAAFCRCVESVEYFVGRLPGFAIVPDWDMARIKADVGRALMRHPAMLDLADDLDYRRAQRKFRALNVGPAALDQREVVEHYTKVALAEARQAVFWPLGPSSVEEIDAA